MASKQKGKRSQTGVKRVQSHVVIKGGRPVQIADFQPRPLGKPSNKSSRTKS